MKSQIEQANHLLVPPIIGDVIQDTRTGRKIQVEEVWGTGHCWGRVVEGEGYKEGPHWKFCILCN